MPPLPGQTELIEDYLARFDRPLTYNSNRIALKQLVAWAADRNLRHIASMEPEMFDLYGDHLRDQRYKIRTLAQKQGTIRRFFEYLVSVGVLSASPVPAGWVPVQPARASREPLLTREQIESMLPNAPDNDGRALIALGGLDGLKLGTILGLTADDVSFMSGRAVVSYRRSDDRPHALSVSAHSAAILRELIDSRPTGPLVLPLLAPTGKRKAAGRRIASAAEQAAMPIHVNPRTLEKSCRANLLAAGDTVHSVRKRLGLTFSNSKYAESLLPPGMNRNAAQLVAQAAHEMDALELLRQAESLCDQPGITPIAPIVIAGAALEMELRRMCSQRGLGANKDSIDGFATALYRNRVITRFVHSSLQAHGKLRNEAAHGTKSNDISIPNARLMVESVAMFIGGIATDDG